MMTNSEKRARRLYRWAVNYYDGDLHKLELALWREVKAGGKLPKVTINKTGAPLRPYRTPEVA